MASGLIASCWSRFANASARTGASPSAWSGWRCVRKIVRIVSDWIPASASRRAVPMPQSIRYGRPSTISSVAGSERSARSGGPPAVPSMRISVSWCCGGDDCGVARCAAANWEAAATHHAAMTSARPRPIIILSLHPDRHTNTKLVLTARLSYLELEGPAVLGCELDIPRLAHAHDQMRGPRTLHARRQIEPVLGDEPPADQHRVVRDLRNAVRTRRQVK